MRLSYSAFEPSHHFVLEGWVSAAASSTHFSATLVTLMDNPRLVEVRTPPVIRLSVAARAVSNFFRPVKFLAHSVLAPPRVRHPGGLPLPDHRAASRPDSRPPGSARPLGGVVPGGRPRSRPGARPGGPAD